MEKIIKNSSLIISVAMLLAFSINIVNAQEEADFPKNDDVPQEGIIYSGDNIPDPETDKTMSADELDKLIENGEIEDWGQGSESSTKVECFDYYNFPSVQVSLGVEKNNSEIVGDSGILRDSFSSGELITFSGEITNENDYPVVDGNLFVRISKKNDDNYRMEGHYIIDEFIALEDLVIDKNNKIEKSFEWKVPENVPSGEYEADYFFSVGKKFNLGGLPFSNEIVLGKSFFNLSSGEKSFISFDRSGTEVNGKKYNHIGSWPVVGLGKEASISQPILNTFNEDKEVTIKYDLYYWDSLNEEDLISTKSEKISVSAGSRSKITYTIPEMNETVYYLKITASSDDQKSIVNIRVLSNQERPRLNYPAITKFPVEKGDNFALFSCFHNTSEVNTEGKMLVTLKDRANNEIGKISYGGVVPSAMSADKVDIKAKKDYDYLTLEAEIFDKNNKLVDKYETVYDCKNLDNCKRGSVKNIATRDIFSAKSIVTIVFIIVIVATVVVVFIEKKKR